MSADEPADDRADALVWYAAYGSNLHLPRLTCYLAGGTPPGSRRTYEGCRDTTPPRAVAPVRLPGRPRFAGDSPVWGGGVAVLPHEPAVDQGAPSVAAVAYLLTHDQVCDLVAQETRQPVGAVTSVSEPPGGSGWYDVLLAAEHEDRPLVALASTAPPPPRTPGPAYLSLLVAGLATSHGWTPDECAEHLLTWPGVEPWTREAITALAGHVGTP